LDLLGLRAAPRGVPRIEVTFTLDPSGSLRVTAHESLHGHVQPLTVQCQFEAPVKYWQTAEVERILRDADLHRAEDEQWMARNAAKSRLEQYVYGLR
jgi:molecular chaperone DnaK (HSP70)